MNRDMELEYTACPLCGSDRKRKAYPNFHTYQVVRCASCNFYYLYPRPNEAAMLDLYSKNDYFEGEEAGYQSYTEPEPALRATFRRLMINMKKQEITGGSLLEVGCGYGYLLDEAKHFFNFRVGTDFSPQAVEQAKTRPELVYQGGVDRVPPARNFDCIIATQVIENVYQPQLFLEELATHLKPGGKMVIATPDMGSFWRYIMRDLCPSFKIPEHILYFNKKSLSVLMKRIGLKNIRTFPYPHAFPLLLTASKLNVTLPSSLNKYNLWMPATTLALYGTYPGNLGS